MIDVWVKPLGNGRCQVVDVVTPEERDTLQRAKPFEVVYEEGVYLGKFWSPGTILTDEEIDES